MAKREFTGNTPRTGRQRSAEQVTARIQDVLDFVNEFFCLTVDPLNRGKVFGIDGTAGNEDNITLFDVVKFSGTATDDQVLAFNDVSGLFEPNDSVLGLDKNYKIGNDGTNGQIMVTDGSGNLTFINPPASTVFIDQAGNFTATPNVNYNIEAGAQITINTADVVPGFTIRLRPQYNEIFEDNNPVLLYNGVNPYENQAENLELDCSYVYTVYSQNGTNLEFSVEAVSNNI